MDTIARAGAELMAEENRFATPDTVRTQPLRNTDAIESFQACVAALDAWPLDEPVTGWDLRLISRRCEDDAQTAYLQRLAQF